MSDPRYLQPELEKRFDHLVEECGEFISAYGKMRRWGAFSVNPELDPEIQETNLDWVTNEMNDIIEAIERVKEKLRSAGDDALNRAFPLYND